MKADRINSTMYKIFKKADVRMSGRCTFHAAVYVTLSFFIVMKDSQGLKSLTKVVQTGGNVKLHCERRGPKSGTFVWWVNGQIEFLDSTRLEQSVDNLRIVSPHETVSVLHIDNFKPINEGNYTCAIGSKAEVTIFVTNQDKTLTKTVGPGEKISLHCNNSRKASGRIVWLFNGEIIFSDSNTRRDNVRMTYENGTSVVKFDRFLQINEGNYTCLVGNIPVITVFVRRKDVEATNEVTGINIMCMDNECPTNLSVTSGSIYVFQCYTNTKMEKSHTFEWRVNDKPTKDYVMSSIYSVRNSSHVRYTTGSQLVLLCQPLHESISCSARNTSLTIKINVVDDPLWHKLLSGPFIFILAAVILVVAVACITLIACLVCKKKRQFKVHSKENEGCYIPAFLQEQLFFNVEIPTSSYILRFAGTLSTKKSDALQVLISCPRDTSDPMNRRLWNSYLKILLQLPEHSNVLRTIGICEDIETSYILQDYSYTVTLKSHLDPEYVAPTIKYNALVYGVQLRIVYDIINGMEFITSRGCCHPGLSTHTILVNNLQLCKLYDFCSREDGPSCVKFCLKRSDDTFKRLAPECLIRGEYSTASDVWSIAMAMWEVFSSGNEPFRGVSRTDFERLLQRNVMLERPSDCPETLYDVMKLCWSFKGSDRPQIMEMKRRLESLSNEIPHSSPSATSAIQETKGNGQRQSHEIEDTRSEQRKLNQTQTEDIKSNGEWQSSRTEAPVYQFPVRPNSNRSFILNSN